MEPSPGDLFIGYDPATYGRAAHARRRLYVREDQRDVHAHIAGSSGTGKSYLMEHMVREDIRQGRGVCVLDPTGDLYERLVRFCYLKRRTERLILVNPRDARWSVGLNYLEYDPATTQPVVQAGTVTRAVSKVFGDENLAERPQLTRWLHNTVAALTAARLTLAESQLFLSDRAARRRILALVDDPYIVREWDMFDGAPERTQAEWLAAVPNRLSCFYRTPVVRRTVGQPTTVNFRRAMDEGAIILANLSAGGQLTGDDAHLIGILLIDKLAEAARSRSDTPPARRRRMYLYVDEFHNYLCRDIALGLAELRKYGLSFVLASSVFSAIRQEEFMVYSNVQQSARLKIGFAMQSEDAELLVNALFPDYLSRDQVKRQLDRTFFRPVLGTAESSSMSFADARGVSRPGSALAPVPSGAEGTAQSAPVATGSDERESEAATESESYATGPFYYYEEARELASIQDYTPEEKKQRLIAQLVSLPDRHAVLKPRGQGDAVPFITPDVPLNQRVLPDVFESALAEVLARCARPAADVDELIRAREAELLGPQTPAAPATDTDDTFTYNADDVERYRKAPVKVQKGRRKPS